MPTQKFIRGVGNPQLKGFIQQTVSESLLTLLSGNKEQVFLFRGVKFKKKDYHVNPKITYDN